MVTIKIHGGLGNQMFEYACGRSIALKRGDNLTIDPSTLFDPLRRFGIARRNYSLSTVFALDPKLSMMAKTEYIVRLPFISKAINKYYPHVFESLGYWNIVKEKENSPYIFDSSVFDHTGRIYVKGYWQSEKYFKEYETIIRKDFSFRVPLEGKKAELAKKIQGCNAICINVRRQEFVRNPAVSALHDIVTPEFYKKAIKIIKEKLGKDAVFFIISDDIEWCQENLIIDAEHIFVGNEYYGVEFRDALQLMSLCKHFIIPNSSFAWWGAWLSANLNKVVISPEKWIKHPNVESRDILPSGWIAI